MRKHLICLCLLPFVLGASTPNLNTEPAPKMYSDIHVEKIIRLDSSVRIHCDLKDMPPIIGQNIPVCIKGLKPSKNPQDNLELLMFLNKMLLSKTNDYKSIILKNVKRGDTFCLIANIEIDGKDLCGLLVQKKLVNKVLEVPSTAPPINSESVEKTKITTQTKGNYIASKSSKVFHRDTCSHVKRMDKSKAITFNTSDEAQKTGRRPCKACKP